MESKKPTENNNLNLPPSLEVVNEAFDRSTLKSRDRRVQAHESRTKRRRRVAGALTTLALVGGFTASTGPREIGEGIRTLPAHLAETFSDIPAPAVPAAETEKDKALKLIQEYQDR